MMFGVEALQQEGSAPYSNDAADADGPLHF